MEGFDIKLEGMFGGQVIPLLSVDGSIQGEVKNWSSAVCQSRESFHIFSFFILFIYSILKLQRESFATNILY